MRLILILQVNLIFLLSLCHAESIGLLGMRYPKFRFWDSHYGQILEAIARDNCSSTIQAYFDNDRSTCVAPCACVISCMFGAMTDELKTNMASATVVLGLAPTLLAYLAPSPAEAAMLAVERPLLTLILTLGETAILPCPAFSRLRLGDVLSTPVSPSTNALNGSLKDRGASPHSRGRRVFLATAISLCQYGIAMAAAVNTLLTSLALDVQTVVSWRCNAPFLVFSWNFICLLIQLAACLSLRWRLPAVVKTRMKKRSWAGALRDELTPCVLREERWFKDVDEDKTPHFGADLLYWMVTLAIIGHLFFGTVVLSSLLLISTPQAIIVVVRYATSACLCRMVLLIELGGIRARL